MAKKNTKHPNHIQDIRQPLTNDSNVIKFRMNRYLSILTLSLTVILACVLIFWLFQTRGRKKGANDVNGIKQQISKHYLLPSDEEPALATVTDKAKISSDFLKKADNGDKVLIYQTNRIAIIYRPSIDRVIAVGPVSIDTAPTPKR